MNDIPHSAMLEGIGDILETSRAIHGPKITAAANVLALYTAHSYESLKVMGALATSAAISAEVDDPHAAVKTLLDERAAKAKILKEAIGSLLFSLAEVPKEKTEEVHKLSMQIARRGMDEIDHRFKMLGE